MEIEIYLHGNPKGFCYLGPEHEKNYFFQRFYDQHKNVGKEFIVECNQSCYYYTYLLDKNVYDTQGRPNSYFGITVKFDMYFKDVISIYTLFETLCYKWVIGEKHLLIKNNDGLQYSEDKISKTYLNNIQADLIAWIKEADESELTTIPNNLINKKNTVELNIIDSSIENAYNLISKHGSISISTTYPLIREQNYKSEIESINQRWSTQVADLQTKYNDAIKNNTDLDKSLNTYKQQSILAQEEKNKIRKEFDEYKSKNELRANVHIGLKEEKDALLKIAKYIDQLDKTNLQDEGKEHHKNTKQKNNTRIKPVVFIIIIILLLSLIFAGIKGCFSKNQTSQQLDDNKVEDVVDKRQTVNRNSNNNQAQLSNNMNLPKVETEDLNEISKEGSVIIDASKLRIDVKELTSNAPSMVKNRKYTISIKAKNDNDDIKSLSGQWVVSEEEFRVTDNSSITTNIKPLMQGKDLLVKFRINGSNQIVERKLNVTN